MLNPLKQMRCGNIADMEGRVLPHQHDINIRAQVDLLWRAKTVMRALHPLQVVHWVCPSRQPVMRIQGQ